MDNIRSESVSVVLNGGSRRGAAALEPVRRLLGRHGLGHARVHAAAHGGELPQAIDRALDEGPDLLVVGGGDGTLSHAAGRVAGTRTALGVLPLGTANDFARTLEVPPALDAAIGTLAHGRLADVDLGWVVSEGQRRPFLNVASLGLSVSVTERLTPGLKRRLGPVAYPVATLRAYRHLRPFSARLEFPDGDHEPMLLPDLLQVAVGNGRYYGGGNSVSPNASIDDHLLDVYAIVRGRARDHVSIARLLKNGRFVEHEQVHHAHTRRVPITTEPALPVNLDGEIAAVTPAEFAVERNAVRVVVPRDSRAAVLDGPGESAA